jgi:hypothetical protein
LLVLKIAVPDEKAFEFNILNLKKRQECVIFTDPADY